MRIVSNHLLFRLTVRAEQRQYAQDTRGILQGYTPVSELTLEFSRSGITAHDMAFGMQTWMSGGSREATDPYGQESWGAHPSDRDGVAGGHVYRAWDPRLQFSVFDTDTLDGADKEAADEHFTKFPQTPDYIVVSARVLKAPWPTYDATHHNKVGVLAHELGLVAEAIAYEAATKNRESVLKSLEKQHEAAVIEAQEDAALQVIVP